MDQWKETFETAAAARDHLVELASSANSDLPLAQILAKVPGDTGYRPVEDAAKDPREGIYTFRCIPRGGNF